MDSQPDQTLKFAAAWQLLFFDSARFEGDENRDAVWNRGAYLVRHLGHCGECHTPRNGFGALIADEEMAGGVGAAGKEVPNISPHREDGIGNWSQDELEFFLELGMMPNGDFAGGSMTAVIDENTAGLTPEDRAAMAVYLRSLPPLENYEP